MIKESSPPRMMMRRKLRIIFVLKDNDGYFILSVSEAGLIKYHYTSF
jgi:hypothetical protein